ncbi:MAG: hypothetical protein IT350_12990 [Deltaproteobacteria bacterium]|nr:hypothetical protein [Deltaproteobacteria bacterium]
MTSKTSHSAISRAGIVATGAFGAAFMQFIGLAWSAAAERGVLFVNDSTAPVQIQNDMGLVHLGLLGAHLLFGALLSIPLAVRPSPRAGRIAFAFSTTTVAAVLLRDLGLHPGLYLPPEWVPRGLWSWALDFLRDSPDYAMTLCLPVAAIVALRLGRDRSFAGLAAMFVGVVAAAWFLAEPPPTPSPSKPGDPRKPDIVLVVMSSLDTTNLESAAGIDARFAEWLESSTVFEEAYVPVATMADAAGTIVTGRLPWETPVRTDASRSAPARDGSLASALHSLGYVTTLIADRAGEPFTRRATGFDRVRAPVWSMRRAARVRAIGATKTALPIWGALATRGIAMPAYTLAAGPNPELVVDEALRRVGRPVYEPRFTMIVVGRPAIDLSGSPDGSDTGDETLAQVARLVEEIASSPQGRETIVVLTAVRADEDAVGERMQHADELRVPIVLHAPSRMPSGAHVFDLVSVADIAPTLAALVGAPVDRSWSGLDLARVARGEIPGRSHLVFETALWRNADAGGLTLDERIPYPDARNMIRWSGFDGTPEFQERFTDVVDVARHRAIFDGRYKLIAMPTPSGVVHELYDVLYDPEESKNIAVRTPSTARRLRETLHDELERAGRYEVVRGYVLPARRQLVTR